MAQGRRAPGNRTLGILAALVLVAGLFAAYAAHVHAQRSATFLRATGLPASVPTPLANLLGLSTVPSNPAPSFSMTDQHGRTVTLASLHGKVVVLEFMDPHCTDICPIVSKELVDANRLLGTKASKVAFVAINVNQFHATPGDMLAFSKAHELGKIPSWQFLTSSTSALRRSWRDYGIMVQAPNPNADIVHTSVVYFIDPSGRERYLADPEVDHTPAGTAYLPAGQITDWGRGVALVAASLAH